MNDDPQPVDPATLRFLRILTTALTGTMIVGFLVIIGLFIFKFTDSTPKTALPDQITLPNGTVARAYTQTDTWYAVVTDDSRILVFSRANGQLIKDIAILAE